MKIYSEKLLEIEKRVEEMAIENDYARKRLELDLVCIYVRELEDKVERLQKEKLQLLNNKLKR